MAPAVDRRALRGPLDIIGDVHGCSAELDAMFTRLGYRRHADVWHPPDGHIAVFVGDLVDRGPDNVGVLRRVMAMTSHSLALVVPGNHDLQLQRYLDGDEPPLAYGLADTVAELTADSDAFREAVRAFLHALPSHYVLDGGQLVVAHTGLPETLHGRDDPEVRHLAAYGVPPGEPDLGDPELRHAWVKTYDGAATVVYGHTPHVALEWKNNTIDIDTGCVYGVRLTALCWPSRECVSVPAARAYSPPTRHFPPEGRREG